MELNDAFGDGWNGASYAIVDTANTIAQGTMIWGSTQNDTICFTRGCYTLRISAGTYSSEISWRLGEVSGGAPTEVDFYVDDEVINASCTAPPTSTVVPTMEMRRSFVETAACFDKGCSVDLNFDTSGFAHVIASAELMIDVNGDLGRLGEFARIQINGTDLGECGDEDCVSSRCFTGDVTEAARSGVLGLSLVASSEVEPLCGYDLHALQAEATLLVDLSSTTYPTRRPTTSGPSVVPSLRPTDTNVPSSAPTTPAPSEGPTTSAMPTRTSPGPTASKGPTMPSPTKSPSLRPTLTPTDPPSSLPTPMPTASPVPTPLPTPTSGAPTSMPSWTHGPTFLPTLLPTPVPTMFTPRCIIERATCDDVDCVVELVINTSTITEYIASAELTIDLDGDLGDTSEKVDIDINGLDFGTCGEGFDVDCEKKRCPGLTDIITEARTGALVILLTTSDVDQPCDGRDGSTYSIRATAALIMDLVSVPPTMLPSSTLPTPGPTLHGTHPPTLTRAPTQSPSISPLPTPAPSPVPTLFQAPSFRPSPEPSLSPVPTSKPTSAFQAFDGVAASLQGQTDLVDVQGTIIFQRRVTVSGGQRQRVLQGRKNAVFDGNGQESLLLLEDVNLKLEDMTLRNGSRESGGCVQVMMESRLELVRTTVVNCRSEFNGGAFLVVNSFLLARESIFMSNNADQGAVAYVQSGGVFEAEGCDFISNDALANGGAVVLDTSSTFAVRSSNFSKNTAIKMGGAVYMRSFSTFTAMTSSFASNRAPDGDVVYLTKSSTLELYDSIFRDHYNSAFRDHSNKSGTFRCKVRLPHEPREED